MFERLKKNTPGLPYSSFGVEILVVILGILIAFQIDRWADHRRDRQQEQDYLVRLKEDLQIEIQSMDAASKYANSRIAEVLLLEEVCANLSVASDRPTAVAEAVEKVTWRSFPQINAFVYSELQSTGNLALIRSDSLRRDLANHYASIRQSERVGIDLNIQQQFDLLTAGILSTAELHGVESRSWDDKSQSISAERAVEIAQELARRKDAVALLPNIAQHHVFNLRVIESARNRAAALIELIDELIADTQY